mmetsp:Transcript_66076/g.204830  ORF Transcript_66076/g.204830 Transcript_66076/m.204830 type:complete len:269 (+) Transcript_66076:697-1503(+)
MLLYRRQRSSFTGAGRRCSRQRRTPASSSSGSWRPAGPASAPRHRRGLRPGRDQRKSRRQDCPGPQSSSPRPRSQPAPLGPLRLCSAPLILKSLLRGCRPLAPGTEALTAWRRSRPMALSALSCRAAPISSFERSGATMPRSLASAHSLPRPLGTSRTWGSCPGLLGAGPAATTSPRGRRCCFRPWSSLPRGRWTPAQQLPRARSGAHALMAKPLAEAAHKGSLLRAWPWQPAPLSTFQLGACAVPLQEARFSRLFQYHLRACCWMRR